MAGKDIVRVSIKEFRRLPIIEKVLSKQLKQKEAAELVGLSCRQVRRIVRRIEVEGGQGLIHRNRGRPSNRRYPWELRKEVLRLYREEYPDFGPTLACEKLVEKHKIKISDETLRLWLREAQVPYPRRKARPHRQWRERKKCCGEMIQIDGSHHDWLEGRGSKMVLMGYIDDATGRVFGRFYPYEGTTPVLDSFKSYIRQYGVPTSVYLDKHTTYKSPAKPTIEDELNNRRPQSQFERAMEELGVTVIHANSPQAKGRVERLFGTLQDRLVKEMRLEGVSSMEEANRALKRYLPEYNRRFEVSAANKADLHRQAPPAAILNSILSIKEKRVVKNDFTVSYKGRLYQLLETIPARKVMVEEWTNGSIHISYQDRDLRYKEILKRAARKVPKTKWGKSTAHKPRKDHPWKRSYKTAVA